MVVKVILDGVPPGSFRDHSGMPVESRDGELYVSDALTVSALAKVAKRLDSEIAVRCTGETTTIIIRRISLENPNPLYIA